MSFCEIGWQTGMGRKQIRGGMTPWKRNIALVIVLAAMIVGGVMGCATTYDKRGRYHKVRSGESLWGIAKGYGVDVQQLAEANNILNPGSIRSGMKLYIPSPPKKAAYKKLPFGNNVSASRSKRSGSKHDSKFLHKIH